MIKKFLLLSCSLILCIGITSNASAINLSGSGWSNITVFDGSSNNSDPWYGAQEDNEVEYWDDGSTETSTGQPWDLEGFFYNRSTAQLVIIGGYDFSRLDNEIPGGDIFVSTSSRDYVMDIDYAGIQWDFVNNGPVPGLLSSTYDLYEGPFTTLPPTFVGDSPDFRRDSGGTLIPPTPNGTVDFYYGIDQAAWGVAFNGDGFSPSPYDNLHHALVVDVSWLSGINPFSVYNTMECGNDVLRGVVPEPGTMILFGLGLLGLSALGRKKS